MYKDHRVAVVMPIHNEEAHLGRAISRVPQFVDLIIAVDDASSDRSWQRLAEVSDARLIRLRHKKNLGVGAATKTGYKSCLEAGADLIAVMDGDGQMYGGDLQRLVDAALIGADYVKGNRFIRSDTIAAMPLVRYIGNRLLSWFTRVASRFADSLDAQCGYTVIRSSALKRIQIDELYNRYGFPNEILFAVLREGFRVVCVPVRTIYGDEVSGINPFTAVPAILFLIGRSYAKNRWSRTAKTGAVAVSEAEAV
jgi:glycosyltransferase involved in cell wall biosynthesis